MTYINNTGIYGNASQTTPADTPQGLNVGGVSVIDNTGSTLASRVKGRTTGTPATGYIGETISFVLGSDFTQTSPTLNTIVDVTSASISLTAGTWLLMMSISANIQTNSASSAASPKEAFVHAYIRDGSNTQIALIRGTPKAYGTVASDQTATQYGQAYTQVVVNPSATTTYKISAAAQNITGSPTVLSFDINNGSFIRAVRIA